MTRECLPAAAVPLPRALRRATEACYCPKFGDETSHNSTAQCSHDGKWHTFGGVLFSWAAGAFDGRVGKKNICDACWRNCAHGWTEETRAELAAQDAAAAAAAPPPP